MKKLILLPNVLHEESPWRFTPPPIDALIAESEKGGHHFLKRFNLPKCPIYLLNEHTKNPAELIQIKEQTVGLISDAGLPCLADPGSALVALAHKHSIEVEALPGPCSILMALQLSGLSGQAFTFHGYVPRDYQLKLQPSHTHIFIEAPYKTRKTFDALLQLLPPHAQLSVTLELMGPSPYIRTDTISGWKKNLPSFQKGRAVFVINIS